MYPVAQKGADASSATDYEELGYDARGLVTSRRLRDGQAIGYGYDALGRLTGKDVPNAAFFENDASYGYDNLGRLVRASDGSGLSVELGWDALGRIVSNGSNWYGTARSQYDLGGRRTRLTHRDGFFVAYEYLTTGETTAIRENGGLALATFGYDDLERRTSLTRGNGTVTSYAYDPVSRLRSLTQDVGGADKDLSLGFGYNPASQIASATRSNDGYSFTEQANGTTATRANGLNQLAHLNATPFTYDGRSNMTHNGVRAFGYTAENRVARAGASGGSPAVDLAYDPLGRLNHLDASRTDLLYDGADAIAEIEAFGGPFRRRYVHGPGVDEPLVWYEGARTGDRRYLHADERGSIVAVTDNSGNAIGINRYDEYGAPAATNIGRHYLPAFLQQLSSRQIARRRAGEAEGGGHGGAEEGVAERGQDEAQRDLVQRAVAVAFAELVDEVVDGGHHGLQRLRVAGEDHPGGERAAALFAKGVERPVDDLARVRLAAAGAGDGLRDAVGDAACDIGGERGLQARGRAEMMEEVGVALADLRGHRLERHGLGAVGNEQRARSVQRGGAAAFRGQPRAGIDKSVSRGHHPFMAQAITPVDLTITPRDRRFGRGQDTSRWWLGGDPVATAFYNALSSIFPKGEAFFVESVRAFRDGTDAKLAGEIRAFVTQEVMHTREHVAFNRRVHDAGYDISRLEKAVDERLALLNGKPKIAALAATMALEHYTAILAHELLADPRHLAGADAETAALWRWHAIEEIEHKGVAFDTWMHATKDWPRFKRWQVKAKVMLLVTRNFVVDRTRGTLDLLAQDGLTGPRVWARFAWFALGRPGMMRKVLGAWASYFMPGFHPWTHDDRALIAQAEAQLGGQGPERTRFAAA